MPPEYSRARRPLILPKSPNGLYEALLPQYKKAEQTRLQDPGIARLLDRGCGAWPFAV